MDATQRFMATVGEHGEPVEYALVGDDDLWVSIGRRPACKRQRWPDLVVTEHDVVSGVNRWDRGRNAGEDAVKYLRHAARMHELHKRWGVRLLSRDVSARQLQCRLGLR
jgi:hypothetical protein